MLQYLLTGLSKYDELVDATDALAAECEAAGEDFPIGKKRDRELARRVWPDLDGDALERKAFLQAAAVDEQRRTKPRTKPQPGEVVRV